MRLKTFCAGLALVAFAPVAIAAPAPAPAAKTAPATKAAPVAAASDSSADAVRAHVEFLASDLLEGRGTGTRGHEIAAAYVASHFRALGFEPAGDKGSYFQSVPFRRASNVDGSVALRLLSPAGALDLGPADAALKPSLTIARRATEARLVFVGTGLDEPRLGLDDYAGLDVKGAIVVAIDQEPASLDSDQRAHLDETREAMAAARGAAGLILLPAKAPKANANPGLARLARSWTSWVDSAGKTGAGAELAYRLALAPSVADKLFDGAPMTLAALRADIAAGRRPRGFALSPRLSIRGDSQWRDFTSPEVVARLPGSDPALAATHVAMMGHLDHLGLKADAKPGEDAIYNGALDNAAGVATLLEAARRFADQPRRPRRSILFVIHTAEELGLLGAQYFATHPTVPIDSIVAGVDLDMPVPLYPFTDVVAFGADHSNVAERVAAAARSMNLGVSPDPMPEEGIFTRSDHYRFVERGIPAILLFTGYANGGKAEFERFFQSHYHRTSDDLSQAIRWDDLARYAELNYRIASAIADSDTAPRWYAGDFFGDLFAPGAPRAVRPAPVAAGAAGKAATNH